MCSWIQNSRKQELIAMLLIDNTQSLLSHKSFIITETIYCQNYRYVKVLFLPILIEICDIRVVALFGKLSIERYSVDVIFN